MLEKQVKLRVPSTGNASIHVMLMWSTNKQEQTAYPKTSAYIIGQNLY